jgi:hypothetical protein
MGQLKNGEDVMRRIKVVRKGNKERCDYIVRMRKRF